MEPNIDVDRISLEERIDSLEQGSSPGGSGGSSPFLISPDVVESAPKNTITEINGGYVLRLEADNLNQNPLVNSGLPAWPVNIRFASFFPKVYGRVLPPSITWVRIQPTQGTNLNNGKMAAHIPGFTKGDFSEYLSNSGASSGRPPVLHFARTTAYVGFIDFGSNKMNYLSGNLEISLHIPTSSSGLFDFYFGTDYVQQISVRPCYSFGILSSHPGLETLHIASGGSGISIIGGDNGGSASRDPFAYTVERLYDLPDFIQNAYPASWRS